MSVPNVSQVVLVGRLTKDPQSRQLKDGNIAGALLNVKTSWIYEAVRIGWLSCIGLGRHIRFTRGYSRSGF